jgi:hypothetical protein
MPVHSVRVTLPIGERRVHLFQAVREHREDGGDEDWIVVGFPADGIQLASVGFDWHRTVAAAAFDDGSFEPLAEGEVPVWGY